jgi:hypothetical protein
MANKTARAKKTARKAAKTDLIDTATAKRYLHRSAGGQSRNLTTSGFAVCGPSQEAEDGSQARSGRRGPPLALQIAERLRGVADPKILLQA